MENSSTSFKETKNRETRNCLSASRNDLMSKCIYKYRNEANSFKSDKWGPLASETELRPNNCTYSAPSPHPHYRCPPIGTGPLRV